jgi:putative peptidoglycan lipid II flippase
VTQDRGVSPTPAPVPPSSRAALSVGSGIIISRLTGFLRDVVIAYFFGTGLAAGAYAAALRIPNVVRNLLGEGALSAAFIPVYSSLLESGDEAAARRLARAVLGFVILIAGLLSGIGVLLAPLLTRLLVPGYGAAGTELTTTLVRILFPMAGVMIVGAWCLGVLNSHRRFFLPFVAPVAWNGAQIAGLLLGARLGWEPLIHVLAWSTLTGSILQLAVQLPTARALAGTIRPTLERAWEPARRVVRNMAPVAASQAIFQVSSLLDLFLVSFLLEPETALAGLYFAQRIAYLPIALFATSVAAAALPEMSRSVRAEALRPRIAQSFQHIIYFVLPSACILALFGDLVVGLLFQRGLFDGGSTALVATILTAYALGLVASSSVKLFASGFHAMQDTDTPMRYTALSVAVGATIGAGTMFWLKARGYGPNAAAGLVLGGALGAWLNLGLLWRGLRLRVGPLLDPGARRGVARIVIGTAVACAAGWTARALLGGWVPPDYPTNRLILLGSVLIAGGLPYLAIAGRPARSAARRPE